MANMPQGMEMLYLLSLLIRGEAAAKLLQWWMLGLGLLAIFAIGRDLGSRRGGLLGALLFALTPIVAVSSWRTGVELGMAFWQAMAAWAFLRVISVQEESRGPWLLACGFSCGMAMGSKYTGIWNAAAVAGLGGYWLIRLDSSAPRRKALWAGAWLLAAAVPLVPWLIKSWLLTGNPVYPFLASWFGDPDQAGLALGLTGDARGQFWDPRIWKRLLATPWESFMVGRNPSSFIGPLLVAFGPLALGVSRFGGARGWLAALFFLQFLAWGVTTTMLRMLIPALPLFCVYCGRTLTSLRSRLWTIPVALILVWLFAWQGEMLLELDIPGVALGRETRSAFLARSHMEYPSPYFDLAEFMDRELPKDAKVLLVGDARAYHVPRNVSASSCFDRSLLLDALAEAGSAEELHAALRQQGFSHMLISLSETQRLLASRLAELPEERLRILSRFMRQFTRRLRQNANFVVLYELGPVSGQIPAGMPEIVSIAIGARKDFAQMSAQQRTTFAAYLSN
jgi:hypothetical protein